MEPLKDRKCVPCEGKTKPLTLHEAETYLLQTPDWKLTETASSISREFNFANFVKAIEFVNQVADLAEYDDHHPDIHVFYSKVRLELSTHALKGLSENDFILAAKIDGILRF